MKRGEEDFACPVCGETVPAKALACPSCGADERAGWGDESFLDVAELPTTDLEEEDYQRFLREELGEEGAGPRGGPPLWIVLTAALLVLALVYAVAAL